MVTLCIDFVIVDYSFVGMFNTDCQENGKEELFGQELGSCGNPWIHLHHLLW